MIYEKIQILTKIQEQRIKKRLNLDFYKELDKLDEKKEKFFRVFSLKIESLVNKLEDKGVLFYSISIELPNSIKENNFWEEVHKHVEEFINYVGFSVELVEFCYFSIEVEGITPKWQIKKSSLNSAKKNTAYLRGIIGVRSLFGKNKLFLYEIMEVFNLSFFEVELKWLSSISEVKESWIFVIKQKNFKFHTFVNYSDLYPIVYGEIADDELKFEDLEAFGQENHFISETMNVAGIQKKSPTKKEKVLYLINLYMIHYGFVVFEDNFFEKINNSKISWQLVYNFVDMKNRIQQVFEEVKSLYPQQLAGFNFMDLMLTDIDSIFSMIKKNNCLVPRIIFCDNVIEFKNGLFFLESQKFFDFSDFEAFDVSKYKTLFFVNCNFNDQILMQKILKYLLNSYEKKKLKEIFTFLNNDVN